MLKKLFALVCILTCLLACTPLCLPTWAAEDNGSASALPYFGREALAAMDNSTALLYAYDSIVSGVDEYKEEIFVYDGKNAISVEEIQTVFDAYRRDHTEQFWLENSYSVTHNETVVNSLIPKYTFTADELPAARIAFDCALESFLKDLDEDMSEFERELYLHDRLASSVKYVEDTKGGQTAYGAIVLGKAVCEGYAEALQCLLRAAGIQSFIIIGEGADPATGKAQPHAWNAVRIDGKYYYVDPTWGDQGIKLYHTYFNITEEMLLEDHTVNEVAYQLPVCNSEDAFYYKVKGGYIEEFSVQTVGQLMAEHGLLAEIYVPSSLTAFKTWWDNNAGDVAAVAGISGKFVYSYSKLGNGRWLEIDACEHSLTHHKSKPASCTENGNLAYLICDSCNAVFESNSTAVVGERVYNTDALVVFSRGHAWNEKLEQEDRLKEKADVCTEHDTYFYACSKCHTVSDSRSFEGSGIGAHSPVKVAAVTPDCKREGKLAHYSCRCGKYFEDSAATKEISDIDNYGVLLRVTHSDGNGDNLCDVCMEVISPVSKLLIILGGVLIGAMAIGMAIVMIKMNPKKRKNGGN